VSWQRIGEAKIVRTRERADLFRNVLAQFFFQGSVGVRRLRE
jgi:hypothetical protein